MILEQGYLCGKHIRFVELTGNDSSMKREERQPVMWLPFSQLTGRIAQQKYTPKEIYFSLLFAV
jgi:hypothetical protein